MGHHIAYGDSENTQNMILNNYMLGTISLKQFSSVIQIHEKISFLLTQIPIK